MTIENLFNAIDKTDRIRIVGKEGTIYVGFMDILTMQSTKNTDNSENLNLYENIRGREIEKLAAVPEIRHKKWKEKNLKPPLEPEQLPQYRFSDLQMDLYYTIYLKEGQTNGNGKE